MDTETDTERSSWDRICDSYKAEYTRGYEDGKADRPSRPLPFNDWGPRWPSMTYTRGYEDGKAGRPFDHVGG